MKELDLGKLRVDRDPGTPAANRKRSRLGRRTIWVLIVAALATAFAFWPRPVAVRTTQVVAAWPSQQYQVLMATGYVVAERKAAVAPKGTGRIAWLGVGEGDSVAAGEVIARLESQDLEAAHEAAEAQIKVAAAAVTRAVNDLDIAQRHLRRVRTLFRQEALTRSDFEDAAARASSAAAAKASADAALVAAQADARNAASQLDYASIRAPFDGVVIARAANVGDVVTPLASAADAKGTVLTIADMSTLQVDADVSESSLAQIRVGQPCEIVLDAFPERRFAGTVSVVVPTVNRASATVTVKVRFVDRDASVLPDMSARVAFLSQPVADSERKPVTAVSPDAIVERDGRHVVFEAGDDGRAHAREVKPGVMLGGVRQITGDLTVGDRVLVAGSGSLADGVRIRVAEGS